MTVLELREQAAFKAEEAAKITEKVRQEGRTMTVEETKTFTTLMDEAEKIASEGDRLERLEKFQAKQAEPAKRATPLELADGARITTIGPKFHRYGQLRAFKGPDADKNAYETGRFLMATILDNAESRQWCHEHGIEIRVQTEGINTAGGYLVPDTMERAIIDLREQYGMFRANARVVPMSSDHSIIPRRTGGVTAYFVGETTATTESDMSWNQVELTAKELAALTRVSASVSEDSIVNIADIITDEMAWAFAKKEDECGLDGDGMSTYGGMVGIRTRFVDGTHTAGQDAGTSPCTAWSHITLADEITEIMSKLPSYAIPRAKWYIHPAGKAGCLDSLAMQAGGNTVRDIATGALPMFGGYPIVVSSAMPKVPTNATVYVLFGDLSMSTTFGDRRGITIAKTADRYFEYRQIGILASERFCIVNHDLGDNTDAGPIVAGVGST